MIVTTYICDKCENEIPYTDLYSIEITRGVKSAGDSGGGYFQKMCCAPIGYGTKHICAMCLTDMFSDIFERS